MERADWKIHVIKVVLACSVFSVSSYLLVLKLFRWRRWPKMAHVYILRRVQRGPAHHYHKHISLKNDIMLKCALTWSVIVNMITSNCSKFKMLTNGMCNFFTIFSGSFRRNFLKSLAAVAAAFDTKRHIPKLLNFCYAFHYLSPFHFPALTLQCAVP